MFSFNSEIYLALIARTEKNGKIPESGKNPYFFKKWIPKSGLTEQVYPFFLKTKYHDLEQLSCEYIPKNDQDDFYKVFCVQCVPLLLCLSF